MWRSVGAGLFCRLGKIAFCKKDEDAQGQNDEATSIYLVVTNIQHLEASKEWDNGLHLPRLVHQYTVYVYA